MTQYACLLWMRSTFCVGEVQFLSLLFIYLFIFGCREVEDHVSYVDSCLFCLSGQLSYEDHVNWDEIFWDMLLSWTFPLLSTTTMT